MSPPRVIHVSTTDVRGGAAKCAHRLHEGLLAEGHPSGMLVAQRCTAAPEIIEYNALAPAPRSAGQAWYRLARRLRRPQLQRANAFFTFERGPVGRGLLAQLPSCDLVNLHWVADFIDYRLLPDLADRVPVVWTFHDMNAFTGGCHYSGCCLGFAAECGACPQLRGAGAPHDRTELCLARKRRILQRVSADRLAVVCPSEWLARAVRRSAAFGRFEVTVIPSGLDVGKFRPVDRAAARRRFGLPAAARIVLFVAEQIGDRRKGLDLLLPALAALGDLPGLLCVTIGQGDVRALRDPVFRHLGSQPDPEALSAAYSAADVFVIPSREDNFPNTVLEAMACGTPVVGFAAGGIPDAVRDGRSGLLAPAGDGPALGPLLRRVLGDRRLQRELGAAARAQAEEEYSLSRHAWRYAELYRRRLDAAEPRPRETRAGSLVHG